MLSICSSLIKTNICYANASDKKNGLPNENYIKNDRSAVNDNADTCFQA